MASTKIDDAALEELRKLASWIEADKVKRNVMVCVDKAREANVRPLLEKLGYANIQSTIDKPDDNRSLLLFPLSIGSENNESGSIQVEGQTLRPRSYIKLTETLKLDASTDLDCLIVMLP
ncbi:uncharacterized protein N7473_012524 [Penicillium subrubescens]|uniref:uncharacterized protein n=1 Tax=Penicillium subrubescens TaxID=1316194 RepID=UPI002544E2C3|nr:uncharacterized protein N7473_012524 [Penicillium subrubescens]KAJ5875177.1 hypothetical protein N7473_012524 [Penicillium subrubescens]